ncbi:MAG: DUF6492 family protein [Woeseiaceae bacterium]|nr:DUF6492 family protein [Woeseiaceae bacterium]
MTAPFRILTVTWSEDLPHFELLRDSLAMSRLAQIPHDVVVQSEDLPLFSAFRGGTVTLRGSDSILPPPVERRRRQARHREARAGRHGTRLLSSVSRLTGWPRWVRYTGWQTQQLSKLGAVAASDADTVVVMDSDVVVTHLADPGDFTSAGSIVAFAEWQRASGLSGKTRNWHHTAQRLFGLPGTGNDDVDCYFDTPFLFHAPSVRDLMALLEQQHGKPWWQVLLGLPPRRWSEFCTYKTYLRLASTHPVEWRDTGQFGYLFDASDPNKLADDFKRLVVEGGRHYITIHSQSAGRRLWNARDCTGGILDCLKKMRPYA